MPNFILGMDGKLYFGDALISAANPVASVAWTEIGNAKDVNTSTETGEADITVRANAGWRATAPTLKAATIEFDMLWKPGDAAFDALRAAWLNRAEISIAELDGAVDVAGNQGLAGNFVVTNFSRSSPLEEAMTVSVTLKASSFTDWYEVPAA